MARLLEGNAGITTVFLIARHDVDETSVPFAEGIRRSVKTLRDAVKRVALVDPIPVARISIPHALARYAATGRDPEGLTISESQHLSWNAKALRLLDSLAGPDIARVSPRERLCRDGACIVQADGTPLYFDAQHLSVHGAEYLVPLFEDLF